METATRKLIDIKAQVFQVLSGKARRQGVSLKRYIEDLLEADARQDEIPAPEGVSDPKILRLIGIAKPQLPLDGAEDERLQYILSK